MSPTDSFISAPRDITTPTGPRREGQPAWNKQRGSATVSYTHLTLPTTPYV